MTPTARTGTGKRINILGESCLFETGNFAYESCIYSRFDVEWLCWDEISFDLVKHLNHKEGKETSVTRLYDGNEICASSGREMLRIFGRAISG